MRIKNHSQKLLVIIILSSLTVPLMAQESEITEESLLIAEEEAPEESEVLEVPLISTWDFIRMLLILGSVVAVIYLLFFLLKRGIRKRIPENNLIRLLGSRILSGNRAIHLIEVGKSIYLIGEADGGVSMISELKDSESVDMLRFESSQLTGREGLSFTNLLQTVLKTGKKERLNVNETVDYMKRQRERLKKL